jgi:hypothetical protein
MAVWWTAAPDIGPAHHASTCSVFLCFALLSFTSVREVADMAVWWTAALDIGPAHHASTCSTFLSFRLRALAKWPIWPCGGRQHRISVMRITLLHALLSFPFVYERSRSGRYGRVVDGSTGYRSCASRFYMLYFPFLSFTSVREVADMAVWWTAAPDIGPAHHALT